MKNYFSIKASVIIVASAIALGGCGNGIISSSDDDTSVTSVTPVTPTTPVGDSGPPQDQVGAGFAASFNQAPFDEPTDPITGDIGPIDKSIEPIPIPDP